MRIFWKTAILLLAWTGNAYSANTLFEPFVRVPSPPGVSGPAGQNPVGPNAVHIADVNGDGRNDVLVLWDDYIDTSIPYPVTALYVHLQNPDGSLAAPVRYGLTNYSYVREITTADLNGDGRQDVILPTGVLYQDNSGKLSNLIPGSIPALPEIADLNGDGRLDIVGPAGYPLYVSILLQNADHTFTQTAIPLPDAIYTNVAVGDMNGDGLTDIVVGAPPYVLVFMQLPGGGFSLPTSYVVTESLSDHVRFTVRVIDVTGDGRADVVIGNRYDVGIGVLARNASGTLDPIKTYPSTFVLADFRVGDVNGDGRNDVIIDGTSNGTLGVFLQQTDGTLGPQITILTPDFSNLTGLSLLAIGDINGDGQNDVVMTDYYESSWIYFLHTPANQPPIAYNSAVTVQEDTAMIVSLSASDANGDALTYQIVTGPAHGALSGTAPGFVYTPVANYNGPDSFTFKASDGRADSNVATVTITISAVNDAPVANTDSARTEKNHSITIPVLANDIDVDGNVLIVTSVSRPKYGTAFITYDKKKVRYSPREGFVGTDKFNYSVSDGEGGTASATVTITVTRN